MNFQKIHELIKKFSGYPTICIKSSYCIYNYLTNLGYDCEILSGKFKIKNKEYIHYIIKISNKNIIVDMTISQFFPYLKYYIGKIYKNFDVIEKIKPQVKKHKNIQLDLFFRNFDKNWYEDYFHTENLNLDLLYCD